MIDPASASIGQHELTGEERRRGAYATHAARRAKREAARQLAVERLAGMTEKALTRLENLLLAEDDPTAARAVREVLDRVLGRPTQAVEVSGEDGGPVPVEVKHSVDDLAAVARILAGAGALGSSPASES